ncbi:hypothetical protein [Phytohabitans rumicis]|uniref:hypothetical protein n=1 Tax=Phytohabitans rumicis TaxID=1076125 RepID=UPI00156728FA|nr:hypothetical protein [Phytohabitans rumicis]
MTAARRRVLRRVPYLVLAAYALIGGIGPLLIDYNPVRTPLRTGCSLRARGSRPAGPRGWAPTASAATCSPRSCTAPAPR